jgi:diguanylate cyclase (GGDEF)-like protein
MSDESPIRVLLVDDDESALRIVGKMLEAEGLAVDVSTSGREALARLLQTRYELVLCDVRMPGMTGIDFYFRLKEEFPDYLSRILFLTGDVASTTTWEFIEERRLPYVLKPVNVDSLRQKLREMIGERPAPPRKVGGIDQRRHRRVAIKATVRIRVKRWATRSPELAAVVNASKEGICFLTDRPYRVGTDVAVCFPYTGPNDFEQDGLVVRVVEMGEHRYSAALALGESAQLARAALAEQAERRSGRGASPAPEPVRLASVSPGEDKSLSELRETMAADREAARRLADELADLRETYQRLGAQRERLAPQEDVNSPRLRELSGAETAMAQVIHELQSEMESLQQRVAEGEAMKYQATHDVLTGVWNRAAIFDTLKRELNRACREATTVSVLMADLDHFKSINDTYGHPDGDAVLKEAAHRITQSIREYDSVGRYGGEEFMIVLVGCDVAVTRKQAERIRDRIHVEPIQTPSAAIPVTVSIGGAASGEFKSMDALIRAADAALYNAKRNGRNRVEMATADEVPTG